MAKKQTQEEAAEAVALPNEAQTAAEVMTKRAEEFYAANPGYEMDFVYATSTGDIFLGDAKGFNNLCNFLATPIGKTSTWSKINK